MDKILNDFLEEEQIQINELAELNRRIGLAEIKLEKMYSLLEDGENDILPILERTKENIAGMKDMRIEYQKEIENIRKQLSDCVRIMLESKGFKYLPPIKRKDITPEQAKELSVKANEKRRRPKRGGVTRKGGRTYVKTNKIQN